MAQWTSFYVMQNTIPWVLALLVYSFTSLIFLPVRKLTDGHAFNACLSGKYGDLALSYCVMLGGQIAHRNTTPAIWSDPTWHLLATVFYLLIGALMFRDNATKRKTLATGYPIIEQYHDIVVIPIFLYLLSSALMLVSSFGTTTEKWKFWGGIIFWVVTFLYDAWDNRLNPQLYVRAKGYPRGWQHLW